MLPKFQNLAMKYQLDDLSWRINIEGKNID